jgi:hypothetical protein
LSVAPDITVSLRRPGDSLAGSGDLVGAGESARTPVAKADPQPTPRRPRERLAATERLTARLANATQALELERERRAAADQALEDERSTTRRLQTELGQARAQLELARAAQAEAQAAEPELEAARTALHERAGALESAREALAREQAEAGRLRSRLERAEKSPAVHVRTLNPSLRHRTYWLGRLLALLVLGIVIAAIWIVLHSTILH